jgi:predicted lipoprotein with Yx(FWY)xxD motif
MSKLTIFLALAAAILAVSATAASSPVTTAGSAFGRIVFDTRGFVLYGFTHDGRGRSNCAGTCAKRWPPYIVRARPAGARLGVIPRGGGRLQLTYAGHPVYYYVGDRKPGQILCQNVSEFGGLWLVIRADGTLVR